MRTIFVLAVLLALALLVSCRSGSNNSHRLLIYTPHGQDLLKDFIARYKQQHPEADVQFLDMGSREVLERVRVERNQAFFPDLVAGQTEGKDGPDNRNGLDHSFSKAPSARSHNSSFHCAHKIP